ncbi:MAG: YbaY family lipoprotein [Cyanobacteria bacterium P01_F01_bin.150]
MSKKSDWNTLKSVLFDKKKHSLWLIVSLVLTPTVAIAQEKSLVLCETVPTTVRVYEENDELLMRAYDRNRNLVWMDRTPTSVQGTNTGLLYNNELGELSVRVNVDFSNGSCSIQVNNDPAKPGTMLRNNTVHSVIGTVTYRARIALPSNSVITTQLVNLGDPALETVASYRVVTSGEQVPIPFHLFYLSEQIDPNQRYGVVSQIVLEGGQRWTTATDYPVLTQNAPFSTEVVLKQGDASSAPDQPSSGGEDDALPEAIASAVEATFTREFGDTPFQIDQYRRESWSDSCLGLGGPAESCLAALTEGWRVAIVDLTTDQRYVYRTNLGGDSIRREK